MQGSLRPFEEEEGNRDVDPSCGLRAGSRSVEKANRLGYIAS